MLFKTLVTNEEPYNCIQVTLCPENEVGNQIWRSTSKFDIILLDEFILEIWVFSETWQDCSKLTYHTCNSTNKGPKNWSITFKGHKAVLLKAILAKTSNFWPIGPIELKFWHLILKIIHLNILAGWSPFGRQKYEFLDFFQFFQVFPEYSRNFPEFWNFNLSTWTSLPIAFIW